ncbi:hypothetical protein RJT34_13437 [Clitoria ternatea]|uniref:F-box domain-containing protein n=1 Tax=Clitoria ternatea TaxID=43366 RepID=A0AAN9JNL0_CLITE
MDGNGRDKSEEEGFLPYDIVINILKRVPVKSLIRFKTVSKQWFNLLNNPHFISQHLHHSSLHNPFLLLHRSPPPFLPSSSSSSSSSCLISPNLLLHDPLFFQFPSPDTKIVASSNGLLCLKHFHQSFPLSLFNPATRQIHHLPLTLIHPHHSDYLGFGFSPLLNDYKVVKISVREIYDDEGHVVIIDESRVSRVQVYSLSSGSWREIDATNLKNLGLVSTSVTANGAIYWQATISSDPDCDSVISFDIGRDVFGVLKGPPIPPPSPTSFYYIMLSVYGDKLAMFRHFIVGNFESCSIDLWVLEHSGAAGESWSKLHSVGPFSKILYPMSIWGDEIVCREELNREELNNEHADEARRVETVLALFNPCNHELKKLPAFTDEHRYVSFNYVESLVPVNNTNHQQ